MVRHPGTGTEDLHTIVCANSRPGGESLFYEAGVGDHAFVVTDSAAGPLLEQVGHLNVGPDGDRVWYLGRPVGGIVSVFRRPRSGKCRPRSRFRNAGGQR